MIAGGPSELLLFAREPAAGHVKTRLAAGLGEEEAAMLYAAFLEDLASALPDPAWLPVLCHDGEGPGPFLRSRFGGRWLFRPQGEGTLGERLVRALALPLSRGALAAVVAGSDAPTLEGENVRGALAALSAGADIAVSPAPDGGFSLLALSGAVAPGPLLARVTWSTPRARADLLRAAAGLGHRVVLLPQVPDVDVLEDLARLREDLAARGNRAAATARVLQALAV